MNWCCQSWTYFISLYFNNVCNVHLFPSQLVVVSKCNFLWSLPRTKPILLPEKMSSPESKLHFRTFWVINPVCLWRKTRLAHLLFANGSSTPTRVPSEISLFYHSLRLSSQFDTALSYPLPWILIQVFLLCFPSPIPGRKLRIATQLHGTLQRGRSWLEPGLSGSVRQWQGAAYASQSPTAGNRGRHELDPEQSVCAVG